jgi:RimJ/RimL family protein N-acetyltransferase
MSEPPSMLIHTPNLRLYRCAAGHLAAILRDPKTLGDLLKVSIPDNWPQHPETFAQASEALQHNPLLRFSGWWVYVFVHAEERVLVGSGRIIAPSPFRPATVAIDCEIAPAFRGRGFAAEALCGLMRYAFTRPGIEVVQAQSDAQDQACSKLLVKLGMRKMEAQPSAPLVYAIDSGQYLALHGARA